MAHALPSPSPRTLQRVGQLLYLVEPGRPRRPGETRAWKPGDRPGRRSPSPLDALRAGQLRWLLAVGHFGSSADAAL
jgi:hypothetical protein